MRIGIEVTQLFAELRSGLYFYTLHLVQSLARLDPTERLTLFTASTLSTRQYDELAELCRPFGIRRFRNPGRPYRLRLALDPISRQDVLFYVMGQIAPPTSGRVNAFLVPDLTPLHDPRWHTAVNRHQWLEQYDQVQRHADVVITFSEHTKADVIQHLGIAADKIHAIPLAPAANFRLLDDRQQVARDLAELGLRPGGYILSVGTLEPRKNHVRLLRAFHRLRASGLAGDQRLVLAGPQGWNFEAIFREIEQLGLTDHVIHVGQHPRLELLMNGATVMAYPSLFEGFGLPPLEAMACGTPVLSSNTSSLPEVVGDAGALVDPLDEHAIAAALARIITDADLRARMSARGLARARTFSWERTAACTLQALVQAGQEHRRHTGLRMGRRLQKAIGLFT